MAKHNGPVTCGYGDAISGSITKPTTTIDQQNITSMECMAEFRGFMGFG